MELMNQVRHGLTFWSELIIFFRSSQLVLPRLGSKKAARRRLLGGLYTFYNVLIGTVILFRVERVILFRVVKSGFSTSE